MQLAPAEANELIEYLVADVTAARFAAILQNAFSRRPEQFTNSGDLREQVTATFRDAQQTQWIEALLTALYVDLKEESHAGRFAGDLIYNYSGGAGLQRLLQGSEMYNVALMQEWILFAPGHVCVIEIGGQNVGTGLLVGPDKVMTAFHVLNDAGLIKDGNGVSSDDPRLRLQCRFDFQVILEHGVLTPKLGIAHPAAADWLGPHSPEHPDERYRKAPPGSDPAGHLDYALIKLAQRVGEQPTGRGLTRGWSPLRKPAKSLQRFTFIRIFQHAAGEYLKGADGRVTQIPPHGGRLQYYVSTSPGSSGAPCWNFDFSLVAMHNLGGVRTNTGVENQGIPVDRIIDHIVQNFGAHEIPPPPPIPAAAAAPSAPAAATPAAAAVLVPAEEARSVARENRVWTVGAGFPILNRVSLQGALEAMLEEGGAQLLSIHGPRYSGRTFSTLIAMKFLARLGHTAVPLSTLTLIDATPEDFLGELCALLTMDPVKAPVGADFSTRASLVHRHLITQFLAQLKEQFPVGAEAKHSLVWLLLDGLDQAALRQETHDMLVALMKRLAEVPALRLVLTGYERALPPEVDPLAIHDTIPPVTAEDVREWLRYQCDLALATVAQDTLSQLAERVLAGAPADPTIRLKHIAQALQNIGKSLKKAAENVPP